MAQPSKHIGKKYGSWTVLSRVKRALYLCRCDCGTEEPKALANVVSGKTKNCVICQAKKKSNLLIGHKFNYLTVLDNPKINGKVMFHVKCDCGNEMYLKPGDVKNSNYKTCGKCKINNQKNFKKFGLLGKKYGLATIIEVLQDNKFKLKCDCGKTYEHFLHHLKTGMPSCGCYWKNVRDERAKKYVGLRFERLTIKKYIGNIFHNNRNRKIFLVKCDCGLISERRLDQIFAISSCGCYQKEIAGKHFSKLTDSQVKAIIELFSTGCYKKKEIANMFGVSLSSIYSIFRHESWKHVKIEKK